MKSITSVRIIAAFGIGKYQTPYKKGRADANESILAVMIFNASFPSIG